MIGAQRAELFLDLNEPEASGRFRCDCRIDAPADALEDMTPSRPDARPPGAGDQQAGVEPFYLPSGAGHDVGMFAGATDIGMLFVRCGNGGISRSPLETMTAADADMGARVLLDVLLNLV